MQDLKVWEEKIKEKRKSTPWKKFVKEIASWCPVVLYKNNGLISRYPKTNRTSICSIEDFTKNRDITGDVNIDYNLQENFFENYKTIFPKIIFPAMFHYKTNENCDYTEIALGAKNSYLSFISGFSENVIYSFRAITSKDVINSINILQNCEIIYFSKGVISSFKIFYSSFIINSNNIWLSSNLTGCSECIFCKDLENKSFCINNKQYEKEEYLKEKKEILKNKSKFLEWYKNLSLLGNNTDEGYFVRFSENVTNGIYVYGIKNSNNIVCVGSNSGGENIYDTVSGGTGGGYNMYGTYSTGNTHDIYCSMFISDSSNIYYSYFLENCSFCLGCIGLKNKSFCILNRQYSKEEWYELADKFFAQMDNDGILGDFFPGSLNPFYFNDTMAYLIDDSFTKEEVIADGYMWRDSEIKVDIPENAEVVYTDLPKSLLSKEGSYSIPPIDKGRLGGVLSDYQGYDSNGNWYINSEIMKKIIKDDKGNIYKIVPMEYDFLMKHSLPLPEIHWLDRIKLGFKFK